MLCYHTHLEMNKDFNEDILYKMYFDWLQNTRNIMEGLNFDHVLPFSYHVHNKRLYIQEFDHDILVIQFITSDNEKHTRFTVEIVYFKSEHRLDLNFSITMTNDSTYFRSVSIPNIFRSLINSSYTLKDQSFRINDQPVFRTYQEFQNTDVSQHKFPFVVINLNDKGKACINPFKLAKELIGVAHVICIRNSNDRFYKIMIYYPNNEIDMYSLESNYDEKTHFNALSHKLRNAFIQETQNIYTLQKFQEIELRNQHQFNVEDNKQLHLDLSELVHEKSEELDICKTLYIDLLDKKQKLIEANEQLKKEIAKSKQVPLIVIDKQSKETRDFLFHFLEKSLNNLDPHETYRKRTILKSIIEKNRR